VSAECPRNRFACRSSLAQWCAMSMARTIAPLDDAALVAEALRLEAAGSSQRQIAAALGKPRHWVRFVALAGPAIGAAPVEIDPQRPLEFHPVAEVFPLIEGADFDDLVADIKANGQHEAIVLLDGKVLDGRNRYRACLAAGVAPRAVAFSPDVHGGSLAFVISKNLKRRHLNESQRAMVAARIANLPAHRPAEQDKSANLPTSQPTAARQLNVSDRLVRSAKAVQDHGTPELVRAVDQGKLAVSAAAQAARLDPLEQRKVVERGEAGNANAARTVINQAAREVRERELADKIADGNLGFPEQKFGVIVADPPWGRTVYSTATGMDRHAANHWRRGDAGRRDQVIASRLDRGG
jgi:ParB-like chromosome segregation protein Spo0J